MHRRKARATARCLKLLMVSCVERHGRYGKLQNVGNGRCESNDGNGTRGIFSYQDGSPPPKYYLQMTMNMGQTDD